MAYSLVDHPSTFRNLGNVCQNNMAADALLTNSLGGCLCVLGAKKIVNDDIRAFHGEPDSNSTTNNDRVM